MAATRVLEDKVDAVVLRGSGCDQGVLSAVLAAKIFEAELEVELCPLGNPIMLEAAIKSTKENPIKFTASK